jgi:hypothetical protein
VFAGAVREAVLSNPKVIQRISSGFVPVALKAGFLQNSPDSDEGRLCREIARSRPAPQGICVVNPACKVLDWALMFDDNDSVLAFLDYCSARCARFPDDKKLVAAERYMKFPSLRLPDVEDSGRTLPVPDGHPSGKHCPATPLIQRGTIIARLFGRALDKVGKPLADTVPQENYVEDRFEVPVAMQDALARAAAVAGASRFRLDDDLARLLVSHAYLGQLDVLPISPPGSLGNIKSCEMWATASRGADGVTNLRIEGVSEAGGALSDGQNVGDGRFLDHEVKLTWSGIVEMKGNHIPLLLLLGRGAEKLKSGKINLPLNSRADVSVLPGGHAIDIDCGVRYGIIGEPVADEASSPAETADRITEESHVRQLVEVLGTPFQVFRERVQDEIKLSQAQKAKLREAFPGYVRETMKASASFGNSTAEERNRRLSNYRQQAQEKLAAFLKGSLNDEQLRRLQQLNLQQEGPFALLSGTIGNELNITDEQRMQFMQLVQEMQQKIEPLIRETQSGGDPQELGRKISLVRKDQETRIVMLLSDAQRKQWQAMLGKPFDLGE